MNIKVFGIPSCGTVKKAKAWLAARRVAFTTVDMRSTPPDLDRVGRWVATFGAKAMRNTSGGAYRALGPEKAEWDEARWCAAFSADPMLIKRPIIERDGMPVQVGFRGDDTTLEKQILSS